MTVFELKAECEMAIANGHGNKSVFISRDDEGNGFHPLYYSFTTDKEDVKAMFEMSDYPYDEEYYSDEALKDVVLLG